VIIAGVVIAGVVIAGVVIAGVVAGVSAAAEVALAVFTRSIIDVFSHQHTPVDGQRNTPDFASAHTNARLPLLAFKTFKPASQPFTGDIFTNRETGE
jgi:hypothetical protein